LLNFTNLPLGETGRKAPGPKTKKVGCNCTEIQKRCHEIQVYAPIGSNKAQYPRAQN